MGPSLPPTTNTIIQLPQLTTFTMYPSTHSDLKNKLRIPGRKYPSNHHRNDKNDLSKAKRIHEPSLDKSSFDFMLDKVGKKPNMRKN